MNKTLKTALFSSLFAIVIPVHAAFLKIEPVSLPPDVISPSGTASAQYRVTNNTVKPLKKLAFHQTKQVTQVILDEENECGTTFDLGPAQSCFINLVISGSAVQQYGAVTTGPKICRAGSPCALPDKPDRLNIHEADLDEMALIVISQEEPTASLDAQMESGVELLFPPYFTLVRDYSVPIYVQNESENTTAYQIRVEFAPEVEPYVESVDSSGCEEVAPSEACLMYITMADDTPDFLPTNINVFGANTLAYTADEVIIVDSPLLVTGFVTDVDTDTAGEPGAMSLLNLTTSTLTVDDVAVGTDLKGVTFDEIQCFTSDIKRVDPIDPVEIPPLGACQAQFTVADTAYGADDIVFTYTVGSKRAITSSAQAVAANTQLQFENPNQPIVLPAGTDDVSVDLQNIGGFYLQNPEFDAYFPPDSSRNAIDASDCNPSTPDAVENDTSCEIIILDDTQGQKVKAGPQTYGYISVTSDNTQEVVAYMALDDEVAIYPSAGPFLQYVTVNIWNLTDNSVTLAEIDLNALAGKVALCDTTGGDCLQSSGCEVGDDIAASAGCTLVFKSLETAAPLGATESTIEITVSDSAEKAAWTESIPATYGVNVYASGLFTLDGSPSNLARWDGTAWQTLGLGLQGDVGISMSVVNGQLNVGGAFAAASKEANTQLVAAGSNDYWAPLLFSTPPAPFGYFVRIDAIVENLDSLDPTPYVLDYAAVFESDDVRIASPFAGAYSMVSWQDALYLAGPFTFTTNSLDFEQTSFSNRIVGSNQEDELFLLGTETANGANNFIQRLLPTAEELYVGGGFTTVGGNIAANRVASWNGANWSAVGAGFDKTVLALEFHNAQLYAGGYFANSGNTSTPYVASFNGSSWSAVGNIPGPVNDLLSYDDTLYAAGKFATLGNVAYWNGSAWAQLGGGDGLGENSNSYVSDILVTHFVELYRSEPVK